MGLTSFHVNIHIYEQCTPNVLMNCCSHENIQYAWWTTNIRFNDFL